MANMSKTVSTHFIPEEEGDEKQERNTEEMKQTKR